MTGKETPVMEGKHANWYETAQNLGAGQQYCTCCERELSGRAIRMLELDQRTDTYHDFCNIPESKSQGWFPFGLTCAKKMIKRHEAKLLKVA